MKVCSNDDCGVQTFHEREPLDGCPGCDSNGDIVPCPECLGTGLRLVPGESHTIVCTGCDYRIDLWEESPAFLSWVEKQTEQSTLEDWGQPPETGALLDPETLRKGGRDTVRYHLVAARDMVRNAGPSDLPDVAAETPGCLFTHHFLESVRKRGTFEEGSA
ncbi:MAG: hypothetical protein ACOCUA_03410 [archaeon]